MKRNHAIIFLLLLNGPVRATWDVPQNVGPGVNTPLCDFAPSLSVSGDTLYFERLESNGTDINIYVSVFRGGAWDSAVSVSDSINTLDNGEGCAFINYDGRRLLFGRYPLSNQSDSHLYYSDKSNGVWQGPKRFEAAFNNDSSNAYWPCFTHDGRRLYFYSWNRPGGRGNGDLWYSEYDTVSQTWGPPVNLGDSINTPDWDFCPTLSWDDRTLYFHSARAPWFNAKIYKSIMVNEIWQGCTILPEPINYPGGRSHYPCLSADGQHLFFGGGDLPLRSYGRFDIYDSQWMVGVESQPGNARQVRGLTLLFSNPLRTGANIDLKGGFQEGKLEGNLYDLRGRRIRTWSGSVLQKRKLAWDGKDAYGNTLPSGVYFLEIKSGFDRTLSKAVVLR